MTALFLGVAQFGSALPWGGRGRGFKSRHSDQSKASTRKSRSRLSFLLQQEAHVKAALFSPLRLSRTLTRYTRSRGSSFFAVYILAIKIIMNIHTIKSLELNEQVRKKRTIEKSPLLKQHK